MAFSDLVAMAHRAAQVHLGSSHVTYAPSVGAPVTITGMFQDPHALAQGDQSPGVETLCTSVFLRLEDLPTDPLTDNPTITVAGVSYHVDGRDPDGMGGILLSLRKVG